MQSYRTFNYIIIIREQTCNGFPEKHDRYYCKKEKLYLFISLPINHEMKVFEQMFEDPGIKVAYKNEHEKKKERKTKLKISISLEYVKYIVMTRMTSIMAKTGELLEYATANTWPT